MNGPGYIRDPAHKVLVKPCTTEQIAECDGIELARSKHTFMLHEDGYSPVIYFPPDAVRFGHLTASQSVTYCPFKGEASYLAFNGQDVAWIYATPYDEVSEIERCVAFFPDRVSVREV